MLSAVIHMICIHTMICSTKYVGFAEKTLTFFFIKKKGEERGGGWLGEERMFYCN